MDIINFLDVLYVYREGWEGNFTYSHLKSKDNMNKKFNLNYDYWIFVYYEKIPIWGKLLDKGWTTEKLKYYMKELIYHLAKKNNVKDKFGIVFSSENKKYEL